MNVRRLTLLSWPFLALLLLLGGTALARPAGWRPHTQVELLTHTVYAYRQWQSTGIKLAAGDTAIIRARGQWLYSPIVGLNGPNGGRPAGPQYPLPNVPGGALLARVGDDGAPAFAGAWARVQATSRGFLYLRINDDLLGDNVGTLTVEISVTPAPAPRPP